MERNYLWTFVAFTIGMVAGLFLATRAKRQSKVIVEKDTAQDEGLRLIGQPRKKAV